jgi:rubredoxin
MLPIVDIVGVDETGTDFIESRCNVNWENIEEDRECRGCKAAENDPKRRNG